MFKLERITKSINIFLLTIFCLNCFGQTKIDQQKSPNSHVQVGNGNVIKKTDNRKFSTTENNIFSGALITGNNPFIVINNTSPNIDSIKWEIESKRKNIRNELAQFMKDGMVLQNKCVQDTNFIENGILIVSWQTVVIKYLQTTLDNGYAVQFELANSNDEIATLYTYRDPRTASLCNFVRVRIVKLDQFITSLY